jgi:hypothetical protein
MSEEEDNFKPTDAQKALFDKVVNGSSRQLVSKTELEQFFTDIEYRMEPAEKKQARCASPELMDQFKPKDYFVAVSQRMELAKTQQRRIDKRRATGFNVFDLIDPDENKLSDVLERLVNPKGGHGQGDLFLRLLFKQLGLGSDAKLTKHAEVQREAPTYGILKYRRRIDVLVEAGVMLAIENKVDSMEQPEQVKDYLEHLHQCTRGNSVRNILIYLTPDGRSPKSLCAMTLKQVQDDGRLHCWSYQKHLRQWLENCRRDCEAEKIRNFISDFIAYIDSSLKRESEKEHEENNEN